MAFSPISGTLPQYQKTAAAGGGPADGYFLKFYNTSNVAISMASASNGSGLLSKAALDSSGYPINGSGDRFIPFIDQEYKIALYVNATDADANTFANADWFPVSLIPFSTISGLSGGNVANITALKALSGQADNEIVTVVDRSSAVLNPGVYEFRSSSSDTDNSATFGTIIQPDVGTGRWHRHPNGSAPTNSFHAENYVDFAAAVLAAAGNRLVISSVIPVETNITLVDLDITYLRGGMLKPSSGVEIIHNASITAGDYKIFDLSLGGTIGISTFGGSVINVMWFGAVPDSDTGGGGTDSRVPIQNAIAAAANGSVVETPIGLFRCSDYIDIRPEAAASGDFYIEFRGRSRNGYNRGSVIYFDSTTTDGIRGDNATGGFLVLKNFAISMVGNRTASAITPKTGVFGATGLHFGGFEHSPAFHIDNVLVTKFETGLHIDNANGTASIFGTASKLYCDFCVVGIAVRGATSTDFTQCNVSNSIRHGIYHDGGFGVTYTGIHMEENGVRDPNFPSTPDSDFYGVIIEGDALVTFDSGTYSEGQTWFCDQTAKLEFIGTTFGNTSKIFGPGEIIYHNSSENLIPHDITNLYETSNSPTITNETYFHKIVKTTGTTTTVLIENTDLSSSISTLDIKAVIFSVSAKIVDGYQNASFSIDPFIQIVQSDGSTDSSDTDIGMNLAEYDLTDGLYHRYNFFWVPRFEAGVRLRPGLDDLAKLTWNMTFNSGSFATNNLDVQLRYPQLRLLTKQYMGSDHALYAGGQSFAVQNVKKKRIILRGLSGASVTWTSAIPAGSVVHSVTSRVHLAVTGATTIDVGDGTTSDLFLDGIGVSLNSQGRPQNAGSAFTGPKLYTTTTNIVITAVGGNFTAGDIAVDLYYFNFATPVF